MPDHPLPLARQPLPTVVTSLPAEEVVSRLTTASRRGRLPGFERGIGEALFEATVFGRPFDRRLIARGVEREGGVELRFETRLRPGVPAIFGLLLTLAVEPGRYLTDRMIPGEWGWIDTRWWYYPMAATLPWAFWVALRRSNAAAAVEAREVIAKIAGEIDGEVRPA